MPINGCECNKHVLRLRMCGDPEDVTIPPDPWHVPLHRRVRINTVDAGWPSALNSERCERPVVRISWQTRS